MSSDNPKKNSQYKTAILLIGILASSGISYGLGYPSWKKNILLTQEISRKKSELSSKQALKSRDLEIEIEKLSTELKKKLFLSPEEVFSLLNNLAEKSRISLKSIMPLNKAEPKISLPTKKKLPQHLPYDNISEIKISCRAEGDWRGLLNFLKNIENDHKAFIIDSVSTKTLEKDIWNNGSDIILRALIFAPNKARNK